jgi:hypothetical protein
MLGFLIGISTLRLRYLLNGAIIGLSVSLISSFLILEDNTIGFILFSTAGIIYGAFIDWFASKMFKVPARK